MIIILLPQTLATDKMKRQRCIRKRSMARNHRMLRVLETIYLLAVMIQTIQAIQGSNRRPTNNRRQRLNPLTEASPESHQRIKRLLHRINKFHNSPQRRNLKLSDHLNFNILDNVREDDATPSTRRWSIQLKALPIWICQNDSKNQDNCHDTVEQEQDDLILQLQQLFPSMTLVAQVQHVLNSIFVELPFDAEIPAHLSGVENIALEEHYQIAQVEKSVLETIGSKFANSYCLTGQGVKVGILDTGVDYTHDALGGSGTREAYLAAYGVDRDAPENKNRDGLFPTSTVVQGKDFLGEYDELYFEDDDPIDANGHGTAVASALLAVAPDVDIVAVKVCITGPQALCPESALVKGIQFMLDPNGIGSLDDKVWK